MMELGKRGRALRSRARVSEVVEVTQREGPQHSKSRAMERGRRTTLDGRKSLKGGAREGEGEREWSETRRVRGL